MDFLNSKNNTLISALVVGGVLALGIVLLRQAPKPEKPAEVPVKLQAEDITIKNVEIHEDNFSGSLPVISGRGKMVEEARGEIENLVYDFKIQANEDVPKLRQEFGADTPTANYSLEIKAEHLENPETESIVISVYSYTGGANGNSFYKVITASKKSGDLLTISNIIKDGHEAEFVALMKKKLLSWRPQGADTTVVFEDAVGALTLSDFMNWSLDEKNLNIYFAKYDVGPGALGAVVLPIPRSEMGGMLNTSL